MNDCGDAACLMGLDAGPFSNFLHGLTIPYASGTQAFSLLLVSEAAVERLAKCLVDIEVWLKVSGLRLNPTKTQMMWLGSTAC